MADNTNDGIGAVSLPGGSFDVSDLDKAVTAASKKAEGKERDDALAAAIAGANQSGGLEALEPGFKYVKRGSLFPSSDDRSKDEFADEDVKVFDPSLLKKQVKDGVVDPSDLTPAPVASPAASTDATASKE